MICVSSRLWISKSCLLKEALVLHVSGKRISEDNINNLLMSRYLGHISRKQNKHVKGPKKRNQKTSHYFLRELEKYL